MKLSSIVLTTFATKVLHTYIADGHHRAASAAKVKKALVKKQPKQPVIS
jgi:uncharacterized protein (DUF1015 family)